MALRRSPFGQKKRTTMQSEAAQARVLEGEFDRYGTCTRLGLFGLHHVDWMHIADSRRCTGPLRKGAPDYLLVGEGWTAWLEIKAQNLVTKRMGRLAPEQRVFGEKLVAAGHEWWTAYLPGDLPELNRALEGKTGIHVDIDGLARPGQVIE